MAARLSPFAIMAGGALITAAFVPAAFASVTVSRQLMLGSVEYFLPPTSSWSLSDWPMDATADTEEFTPLTVVEVDDVVNAPNVQAVLDTYKASDDVWTSSFAQVLCIQSPSGAEYSSEYKELAQSLAQEYGVQTAISCDNTTAAPGPYFIHKYTGDAFQAYKLYADTNQAFIQSSYQDPSGTHHTLPAAIRSAAGLTIAVPSRLSSQPTPSKPLAGLRLSVKDLYHLQGMKTSFGNRAHFAQSTVQPATALAVQKLIDAGAIVVGKNKLSEFAYAGPFFTDHIDYLLPFNPRGDGYNSPSDSSGGSGAAVASYEWLDASLGSDTGGSVRVPAAANGVHGNRPTRGAVGMEGALPLSETMDTAGVLARDLSVLARIGRVLYADETREYEAYPKAILLDEQSQEELEKARGKWPDAYAAAQEFMDGLKKYLSADVTTFSIDKKWKKSAPEEFGNRTIGDVGYIAYPYIAMYEQWRDFGQDFVETYKSAHDGAFPYMNWGTRSLWFRVINEGTEQAYQVELNEKKQIAAWGAENVLSHDQASCSDAIYLYFQFWDQPTLQFKPNVSLSDPYVDQLALEYFETKQEDNCAAAPNSLKCKCAKKTLKDFQTPDTEPFLVSPMRFASLADLPDYAVTLGSFNYGGELYSPATLQSQSWPLTVNIMAAKGCDFMILNLLEDLKKQGVVRTVKTGKEA